jgi:hypothetical protein
MSTWLPNNLSTFVTAQPILNQLTDVHETYYEYNSPGTTTLFYFLTSCNYNASWCSSNGLYLYTRGSQFESRLRHPLLWLKFFVDFLLSLQAKAGIVPWLGYDYFVPNPFQFIIQKSSYHLSNPNIDTVVKWTTKANKRFPVVYNTNMAVLWTNIISVLVYDCNMLRNKKSLINTAHSNIAEDTCSWKFACAVKFNSIEISFSLPSLL